MMQLNNTMKEIHNKDESILPGSAGLKTQPQVVTWQGVQGRLPGKQVEGDQMLRTIQILVPLYLFTNYQTFAEIAISPSPGVSHYANSIEIFLAYVDEDEELCTILQKWLDVLKRQLRQKQQQNLVTSWSNANVLAGRDWKKEVERHLATASVILLLVSTDFLHSSFCYEIEMKEAMKRHEKGEARVIPVILRPCVWQSEPFGILKPLPTKGKAVTKWHNRDDAFLDISQGIQKAIEDLFLNSTF